MNPMQIKDNLKTILDGYPNTYTFTKSLAEKTILKRRGTLPTCIVRPSMVGATNKEPFVGWTDTLSAIGAPLTFGGIGIYKYQIGNGESNIDPCAVDQCINHILIATCHCAFNPHELHIYNHTSTYINPLSQKIYNYCAN